MKSICWTNGWQGPRSSTPVIDEPSFDRPSRPRPPRRRTHDMEKTFGSLAHQRAACDGGRPYHSPARTRRMVREGPEPSRPARGIGDPSRIRPGPARRYRHQPAGPVPGSRCPQPAPRPEGWHRSGPRAHAFGSISDRASTHGPIPDCAISGPATHRPCFLMNCRVQVFQGMTDPAFFVCGVRLRAARQGSGGELASAYGAVDGLQHGPRPAPG